jgi:hypothetical protein
MNLTELSLQRIVWLLPEFPGEDLPAKLAAGRLAAEAALRSHLPDLQFDVEGAEQVMRTIDAWSERNSAALSAAMKEAGESLPETLQTSLGSAQQVRDFLVAVFTLAASGLGPWSCDEVGRVVSEGEQPQLWAEADAESRLQAFGIIVKLEQDGQLGPLLLAETSVAGLGAWPAAVVIVVASLIFAACVVTCVYLTRRLSLNNRLMRDLCERAQAEGRTDVVKACIEATRGLQEETPLSFLGKAAYIGLGLAAAYLTLRYVLPAVLSRPRKK